jgi:hypothetical protein
VTFNVLAKFAVTEFKRDHANTGHSLVCWKSWENFIGEEEEATAGTQIQITVSSHERQFISLGQIFCHYQVVDPNARYLNKNPRDEEDENNSINLGTSLENGTKAVASVQQG